MVASSSLPNSRAHTEEETRLERSIRGVPKRINASYTIRRIFVELPGSDGNSLWRSRSDSTFSTGFWCNFWFIYLNAKRRILSRRLCHEKLNLQRQYQYLRERHYLETWYSNVKISPLKTLRRLCCIGEIQNLTYLESCIQTKTFNEFWNQCSTLTLIIFKRQLKLFAFEKSAFCDNIHPQPQSKRIPSPKIAAHLAYFPPSSAQLPVEEAWITTAPASNGWRAGPRRAPYNDDDQSNSPLSVLFVFPGAVHIGYHFRK